jgi:hypothetical protein
MRMGTMSVIPRKHAHSLRRRPSLAFIFGTFAYAKDQASLLHDGLLRKTRHPALMTCLELLKYD